MPVDLPPTPEHPLLRVVAYAGWLRVEARAWILIWRFRIADAIRSAATGVGWVALFLSQRRWHAGIWFFRLASAILIVATWIKPDPAVVNEILQRHRHRGDGADGSP